MRRDSFSKPGRSEPFGFGIDRNDFAGIMGTKNRSDNSEVALIEIDSAGKT